VAKLSDISGKLKFHQRIAFKGTRLHVGDFVQVFVTQVSDRFCGFGQGSNILCTQS
jgi:hypothetical protein